MLLLASVKAIPCVPHLLVPGQCFNSVKTVSPPLGALREVRWFCDPAWYWYHGVHSFSPVLHVWEPGQNYCSDRISGNGINLKLKQESSCLVVMCRIWLYPDYHCTALQCRPDPWPGWMVTVLTEMSEKLWAHQLRICPIILSLMTSQLCNKSDQEFIMAEARCFRERHKSLSLAIVY